MTFDSVLVPTDGSDSAEAAAHRGFALATALDATVHVLSVADVRLAASTGYTSESPKIRQRLREQASIRVESLASVAAAYDVEVVEAVREGIPATEIVEYATENGLDAIVMGTAGRGSFGRLVVGSVADTVVRTAPVPVMTVSPDTSDDARAEVAFDDLLIPTDGSDAAEAAARRGLDLAEQLGATVHLLAVADTALERSVPAIFDADDADPETLMERVSEHLTVLVTEALERDLEFVTVTRKGIPAAEIIGYAGENGIDCIVMGTHGGSGIKRFVIGSVADKVIRTAPVPVTTIRAEDSAGE